MCCVGVGIQSINNWGLASIITKLISFEVTPRRCEKHWQEKPVLVLFSPLKPSAITCT